MLRKEFPKLLIGFIALILTPVSPVFANSAPEGMVLIKGGCFMMGTDKHYLVTFENEPNHMERPAHKVCLDSFYMDTHEATQKKWKKWMPNLPTTLIGDDLPVDHVRFREARTFCARRGGRLPTEAEWEYAAKAGSTAENFWGDGINGDYSWYDRNSTRRPHPVGTKKPNPWGLYDMMGSVWEWVSDWYDWTYYQRSPIQNPQGPKFGSARVIKGASWLDDKSYFRAAMRVRGRADPTETFLVGVRCVKSTKGK
ncbi:MAG: formylglycine-generating enzyme family protein [Candidatus Nitronauta litoralis]|uniref:Formylglycine-generating enzyme family protein n=1 Tax=Candidatus Nitronauta litoralis TaxID=2705533 RepID=A0A7T0G1V0_9BACT|nr:MAG: formylglycine-generating enzyme family protein [Candidatus Nitronauta litoralis]